jgi:hypothetical protein
MVDEGATNRTNNSVIAGRNSSSTVGPAAGVPPIIAGAAAADW